MAALRRTEGLRLRLTDVAAAGVASEDAAGVAQAHAAAAHMMLA
jgi:hypothetical protein